MPLVFDPKAVSPLVQDAENLDDWKQLAARCKDTRDKIVSERRAAGEVNPECVPVVHRKSGQVRFLNFDLRYAGSLNHAEDLLKGRWRLATKAEEQEEYEHQAAARRGVAAARIGEAMNAVGKEAAAQVAKATETAVANATANLAPKSDKKKG